jgi:hypothetical protein
MVALAARKSQEEHRPVQLAEITATEGAVATVTH